jgi:hypothetical protein
MLKVPRIGGAAQLRLFVEQLGLSHACKAIDVHPATMRRWLREQSPVPQAPLQALYWLTTYGMSDAAAEVHWSHQFLVGKVHELQAAIDWRAPPTWCAANECDYHAPGLLVPMQA